jgi:hypothetical protein
MKFAAGLTVSGIIGFIVLEALKLVVPTLAVWILGALAFLFKILLVGVGLVLAAGAIGLAIFLYRRSQRTRAEA